MLQEVLDKRPISNRMSDRQIFAQTKLSIKSEHETHYRTACKYRRYLTIVALVITVATTLCTVYWR